MYGYGYGYGIDPYYLILVVPMLLLSLWAQFKVKSTFSRFSEVATRRGYTGAQVARKILDANGLGYIEIEHIAGTLTDHYDPQSEVVRLSDSTFAKSSVAAAGVAAHESGHAVQYAEKYAPLMTRNTIVPIVNFGSTPSAPLIIAGFVLGFGFLAYIGIALFGLSTLFQLITLPVELNASKRAIAVLEGDNILEGDELDGAKKVLKAAALTYLAALLTSAATLLRYIALSNRRR